MYLINYTTTKFKLNEQKANHQANLYTWLSYICRVLEYITQTIKYLKHAVLKIKQV